MTTNCEPVSATRRAIFAGALGVAAASALPASASDTRVHQMVAKRQAILDALDRTAGEDEDGIAALCDRLSLQENAMMLVPITSREAALMRLEIAASYADSGDRYSAARTVEQTIHEAMAYLRGL